MAVLAVGFASPIHAQSYDWAPMALVSDTMGIQPNRLCVGEATRGDIGCPDYAPSITRAGLEVSGMVSATRFLGDGSGLTGVAASTGDRIVSGTTSMVADGATGYISLTQSTGNTGWFDPQRGLVTLGVSATGTISATAGYFSGPVGIGVVSPLSVLHLRDGTKSPVLTLEGYEPVNNVFTSPKLEFYSNSGGHGKTHDYIQTDSTGMWFSVYSDARNAGGGQPSTGWYIDRSANLYQSDPYNTGTESGILFRSASAKGRSIKILPQGATGYNGENLKISAGDGYGYTSYTNPTDGGRVFIFGGSPKMGGTSGSVILAHNGSVAAGNVGIGLATPTVTLQVSGTALITSWTGINFSNALNVTPTAPLEVSGTVSATRFVGDGSGLTNVTGAVTDRLISGTAALILSPTGVLNLNGRIELVSGTGNVLVGPLAGFSNTGTYLTALGYQVARYNSGTNVVALGNTAANTNTGSYVQAIGQSAAQFNAGGYLNAFGQNAASNNSGTNVNAFGTSAAQYNTGAYVVAIGQNAARYNTYSNVIALGYNASPTQANQVVLGNSSIVEVSTTGVIRSGGLTTSGTVLVSSSLYADNLYVNGSPVTGGAGAPNDNLVSGSAYVKALQDTGASVSGSLTVAGPVSATGDIKGNTLRLADGPADTCNTANAGAFKRVGKRFYFCRP